MMYRIEKDSVGELEIPADSYYGVHSLRAKINFPITNQTLDKDFIISLAQVKINGLSKPRIRIII